MRQWRIGDVTIRVQSDRTPCPPLQMERYRPFEMTDETVSPDILIDAVMVSDWSDDVSHFEVRFNADTDASTISTIDVRSLGGIGQFRVVEPFRLHGQFRLDCASEAPLDRLLRLSLALYLGQFNNGVLLHSSGVSSRGGVWLFAGPSGIGKSTIARELRGERHFFTEDIAVLRFEPNRGVVAWSTPFGKGDVMPVAPSSAKVIGILFLEQGTAPRREHLTLGEYAKRLFCETRYYERDTSGADSFLGFCDRLYHTGLCEKLTFAPNGSFWDLLES